MKGGKRTAAGDEVIGEFAPACLLMRTRLISRVVTGIYDQELRDFGLNSPQFALLVVIFNMGPSSRAEIGRYHHQDRSTLTRNLKIMISEGWIEESASNSGGRARPIVLTETGIRLLRKVAPAWRKAQQQAKVLLGDDYVTVVTEVANRIAGAKPA